MGLLMVVLTGIISIQGLLTLPWNVSCTSSETLLFRFFLPSYWVIKEAKKNQKVVEVKETRLSLNIDTNDFNTKLNQTAKFLAAGHKVKVSIRFRGREMAHSALGADVLKRFAEALPQASTDKPPVLEGRTMSILLIPKPNKD